MREDYCNRTKAELISGLALGLAIGAALLLLSAPLAAKPLKKIGAIELPGPLGKPFDALAIDSANHLLFVSHQGADSLYVVDLATNRLRQTVRGLPGVRGVAYVFKAKEIFASSAGDDSIAVIDAQSFSVLKKIPTEAGPGAMTYAEPFGKLFVSEDLAGAVAVMDVGSEAALKMVRFGSRTGALVFDSVANKVYVSLPDAGQLAVIDPAEDQVTARYPVGRCRGNSGMALDAARRLAFLSCEENEVLAVFDLRTNLSVAYLPMATGGAGVALDPKLGRVYVACVSGAISVYEEREAQKCHKLNDVSAAYSVHSLVVDAATRRIYVPEQEEDGVPVSRLAVYEERP
jgi:DNA-binding beta-propeller fold protein YncE